MWTTFCHHKARVKTFPTLNIKNRSTVDLKFDPNGNVSPQGILFMFSAWFITLPIVLISAFIQRQSIYGLCGTNWQKLPCIYRYMYTDIWGHKTHTQGLRWVSLQVSGMEKGSFVYLTTHITLSECVCFSVCVCVYIPEWCRAFVPIKYIITGCVCTIHYIFASTPVLLIWWPCILLWGFIWLIEPGFIFLGRFCNTIFPIYVYHSRASFIQDKSLSLDGRCWSALLLTRAAGQTICWIKKNIMSGQISLRLTVICWLNTSRLLQIFLLLYWLFFF